MRRNRSTPFEVMRSRSEAQSTAEPTTGPAFGVPAPAPAEPEVQPGPAGAGGGGAAGGAGARRGAGGRSGGGFRGPSAWWAAAGAGTPVVLRVPRGLAVLTVAAAVGLLVLAYWVGHARGVADAQASSGPDQTHQQMRVRDAPAAPAAPGGTGRGGAQANLGPQPPGNATTAGPAERLAAEHGLTLERQEGYGYLILATWPHEEARRLQAFLAEQGLATTLERHDNARSRVRTVQGFTPNDAEERTRFRSESLEHGRDWARHVRNRNQNLSDAYWSPY